MPKSLLEMVLEVVCTQTTQRIMSAEDIDKLIKQTYRSLKEIEAVENRGGSLEEIGTTIQVRIVSQDPPHETPAHIPPHQSISIDTIVCLECGKEFKALTHTHLKEHGLSPEGYRQKYAIPATQPLAATAVSERRKARAREQNVGELLKLARVAKRAGRTNGKAAAEVAAKDKESWLVQMLEEEDNDRTGNFLEANFKRITES